MFYNLMLYVSLKKDTCNIEKNENNSKFGKKYTTKNSLIDYYFGMNLDKNIRLIALFSLIVGFIVYHLMLYYSPEVENFKIIWTICRILASVISLMLFLTLPYINKIMFNIIGQKYIGGLYYGDLCLINNNNISSKKIIDITLQQSLLKLRLSGVIYQKNQNGELIKECIFDGSLVEDNDTYSEFLIRFTKTNYMSYGILKLTFSKTEKNELVAYGYLYETTQHNINTPTQDVILKRK